MTGIQVESRLATKVTKRDEPGQVIVREVRVVLGQGCDRRQQHPVADRGRSYRTYRQERHRAARVCTVLGLTAISVGGALGGHLSYAQGAGMFHWQPLRATIHHSPIEYQRAA